MTSGQCASFFIVWAVCSVFLLQSDVISVVITELRVPPHVKNGTDTPIILDCLYTLRPEEQSNVSGLVVKWFFSKSQEPVYQWIHNKKPQALGAFKNRLWLDYKATDDNMTAYRALYITHPTVDLSGEYKCIVSTYLDEDFGVKKMIVFAPEKQLDVFHSRYDVETINISCRAVGVFPEPELWLYNDSTRFEDISLVSTKRTNAYDVTAYVLIPDTELPTPTAIDCFLTIPQTPYQRKKTLQYNPGSTESLSSVSGCAVFKRSSTSTDTVAFLLLTSLVFAKLNAV